jgi:hypothetical protein
VASRRVKRLPLLTGELFDASAVGCYVRRMISWIQAITALGG